VSTSVWNKGENDGYIRSPMKINFETYYFGDKTIFNSGKLSKILNENFIGSNRQILEEKLAPTDGQNILDVVSVLNETVPRNYLKRLHKYDEFGDKSVRLKVSGHARSTTAEKVLYGVIYTKLDLEQKLELHPQEPERVFEAKETLDYYVEKRRKFTESQRKKQVLVQEKIRSQNFLQRRRTLTPVKPYFENNKLKSIYNEHGDSVFRVIQDV
jgi:hypothetical protein